MIYANRVASSYQFVLKDLNSCNNRLIFELTLLALGDIEYHETIVDVIVKHISKVEVKSKLYAIYLIDSILKTVEGAIYKESFGQKLEEILFDIYTLGTSSVRDLLCKTRQTWKNLLSVEILNKIDAKIQRVDVHWPYTLSQRVMLSQLADLNEQLTAMQMEVDLLEKKAEREKEAERKIQAESEKRVKQKKQDQEEKQDVQKKRVHKSSKRSSTKEASHDELPPKRSRKHHLDLISAFSSVLLTPSPEPQNTPSPTIEKFDNSTNSSDDAFWSTINSAIDTQKSNSPLIDENAEVPFIFELSPKSTEHEADEVAVCDPVQNKNISINDTIEEEGEINEETPISTAVIYDWDMDAPSESFVHFDCDDEIFTEINEIEQTSIHDQINDGENISAETLRTTPPMTVSMDGNIEFQPINLPTASKPIKINLLNPIPAEQSKIEVTKTTNVNVQKKIKPSEWETPAISYELKESMKNVKFCEKPVYRQGIEQSGMCSIM